MPDNAPFVRDAMQDFVAEFLSGSEAFKRRYPGMPAGLAWHCEPIRAEFMEAFNAWLEGRLARMPTAVAAFKAKEPGEPPKPEDFGNRQMALFQDLLCNTALERDSLSNVFDLWDSIPRYSVSRQQQDKWRKAGAFPQLHHISFHYRGRELKATIQPAWIQADDGTVTGYYPSANEELIEDVLRKIATGQNNGYFDTKERRCGVVFTLYMVRKELERRGHGRTYSEINMSLEIMSSAVIKTKTLDGNDGDFTSKSLYLNNLFRVSKDKLAEDPKAKWFVDFHPFASRSLDELTYRQFNYARLMSHKNQLSNES